MGRKSIVSALACGVCATVLLPQAAQAAQDRVSATEKGSVFIFSKVEVIYDDDGDVVQDTFLQLTNDNNQPVDVQMYFVNGDDPVYDPVTCEQLEPGWNWIDNRISLTANQPAYWSAASGLGTFGLSPWSVLDPDGPGRLLDDPNDDGDDEDSLDPERVNAYDDDDYTVIRGFIVGWAVNADNEEIQFDHLAGTATLVDYELESAWEYNAWSFQGVSVTGDGQINLDGSEFAPAYGLLLYNFYADDQELMINYPISGQDEMLSIDSYLTLHPVSADLRQETEGPVLTKAHFDIWNENEIKFSGAYRCIECWDQFPIEDAGVRHMDKQFLQTVVGKARIDGLESQLCDRAATLCQDGNDSEAAAILGVAHRLISFDGNDWAEAGGNLFGMGTEDALIQYDTGSDPPPTGPAQTLEAKLNNFVSTFGLSK